MNAVADRAVWAAQWTADLRLYRLTVGQYLAMIRAGIIGEADRVELIHGWMVEKMTKRQPHSTTQMRLNRWLNRSLSDAFVVGIEIPVALSDSVPEPDVCIVRGAIERYDDVPPTPDDVALVIEVSDSTLNSDRAVKRRVYAGAGIAQMWIVNLIDRQIEVYTDPDGAAGVYRTEVIHQADGTITLVLDGASIASCQVAELLP